MFKYPETAFPPLRPKVASDALSGRDVGYGAEEEYEEIFSAQA
jgi:hypothetical protein